MPSESAWLRSRAGEAILVVADRLAVAFEPCAASLPLFVQVRPGLVDDVTPLRRKAPTVRGPLEAPGQPRQAKPRQT